MTAELLLGIGCVGVLTAGAAVLGVIHLVGGTVGTRISKPDGREVGISDLTDAEDFRAEVDRAHADIHDAIAANICPLHPGEPADDCGQGCVWLTVRAQIDDRRPPGRHHRTQPLDEWPTWMPPTKPVTVDEGDQP